MRCCWLDRDFFDGVGFNLIDQGIEFAGGQPDGFFIVGGYDCVIAMHFQVSTASIFVAQPMYNFIFLH
jgi:hypothetical protein